MSARADIMAFVGANARGFHDAMKRVRGDAKETANNAQRDFASLSTGMTRSINLLKGTLAGVGIGLSLQGAQQIMSEMADIDREARRAGVSVKALQEMKYVADKNRIDVNAMVDGLKELNLRADEFVTTGKGSAAEAFARLGIGADDLKEKLKKPSDLFIEIIGRVGQLNKAAQIRIMDELFGGSSGERFVELIGQGEEGIRRTIMEAHQLGAVIDEELINSAVDLDTAFSDISNTVSIKLKGAVVEAYDAMVVFKSLFDDFESRSTNAQKSRLRQLQSARTKLDSIGDGENSVLWMFGKSRDTQREAIDEQIAKIQEFLKVREELNTPADKPYQLPPIIVDTDNSGGKGARSKAISEAERQRKAADELIASLEHEYQALGKTAKEQRISNELRKLGVGATDEQKDRIAQLITVIDAEVKAQERANKAQQQFIEGLDQLGSDAVDALGQVITGTENAADAFKKLAIEIVKSALTGKGAYADFFQGLFGGSSNIGLGGMMAGLMGFGGQKSIAMNGGLGLYAKGGITDVPAIFGEAGPEAAVPLPDGRSIPVDLRMSSLPVLNASNNNNTPSAVVHFAPVIDARGADKDGLARVEAQLSKMQRELPATVIQTVRKISKYNVKV